MNSPTLLIEEKLFHVLHTSHSIMHGSILYLHCILWSMTTTEEVKTA